MAFLRADQAEDLLARDLEAFTDGTCADRSAIIERLVLVRERGFAVNVGEWRAQVVSISRPILSVDGQAIAAMTISIPINRFSEEIVDAYGGWGP